MTLMGFIKVFLHIDEMQSLFYTYYINLFISIFNWTVISYSW